MTFEANAQAKREAHAAILMMSGSYAAAEALYITALSHKRKAALSADHELMEHWDAVADIFEEAKRKLGALT